MTVENNTESQDVEISLPVGSRVSLLEGIDIDESEGSSASILFEGYVEQYVPQTNKLSFEDSDIGYAEFQELLGQADGVEIYTEYQ